MDIGIFRDKKKALYTVLFWACVCVFAVSAFLLARKIYGYHIENKRYMDIREMITESSADPGNRFSYEYTVPETGATETTETTERAETTAEGSMIETAPAETGPEAVISYIVYKGDPDELGPEGIFTEYEELKKINDDLVGWITMPGFSMPIDYPVLQAEDHDFYLRRDFYKNHAYSGSIFMDLRNDPERIDSHIVIYGHAMNNKSMFGNLKEYPDSPDDYTVRDTIYLDLLEYRMEYRVFSTYFEDAEYNNRQTFFRSNEEYLDFLLRIRSKSVYDFGIELNHLDKILTLSTCNNRLGKEMRAVIHAKLTKVLVYDEETAGELAEGFGPISDKHIVSANVDLVKLTLSYIDGEETVPVVTEPAFSTQYLDYTAVIPRDVERIAAEYQLADPKASIKFMLNGKAADEKDITLGEETNIIKAAVVSRDGQYERTYAVYIVREDPPEEESAETTEETTISGETPETAGSFSDESGQP